MPWTDGQGPALERRKEGDPGGDRVACGAHQGATWKGTVQVRQQATTAHSGRAAVWVAVQRPGDLGGGGRGCQRRGRVYSAGKAGDAEPRCGAGWGPGSHSSSVAVTAPAQQGQEQSKTTEG